MKKINWYNIIDKSWFGPRYLFYVPLYLAAYGYGTFSLINMLKRNI